MTLKDLFTDKSIWGKYGDMDVYNDCIDDMASAWCGTQMTKAGLEHYGDDLLSTEIEIDETCCGCSIECKIDDCPDYSKRWRKIKALFDEAAGYLGVEEYDMWFIDDVEEPPKDDGKETNAGYDILMKLTSKGRGYEEGYVLGFMQKSTGPEWVTWGYSKHPNEEPSYYWGHYFNDADTAKKDLLARMAGMLNNMESMI